MITFAFCDSKKYNLRGSIHQEPYKEDFFKLFTSAFNAGLTKSPLRPDYLSADARTDIIVGRAPELADATSPYTTWSNLQTIWQEWTYAWNRANQIRSY